MSELVSYQLQGPAQEGAAPIATIAMDDGKVNAFSVAMLDAVHGAFDRAREDEAVVLFTGRDGRFSAGFDLKVFAGGDVEQVLAMLRGGATLAERIAASPRPVVIAANGHAVAAGSFMLLAADARIGVDGPFQLGLNEVNIGLTVPLFVVELARHRLAPAHFVRSVLDAAIYTPAEALTAGFLDRVVAAPELHAAGLAEAQRLAALNMAAYAATKQRVRGRLLETLRETIERELTPEGLSGAQAPA
jgi:enoyl-CoA hydratase